MPNRDFMFETDCINAKGHDINMMRDEAVDVTYGTMLRHCDILTWAVEHNYELRSTSGHGLTLRKDWSVSYHKSRYRGLTCYFLVWSHIEYIWVDYNEVVPMLVCPECSDELRRCSVTPEHCLHCRTDGCWCGSPRDAHRKEVIDAA